jgi:hypothetical protein
LIKAGAASFRSRNFKQLKANFRSGFDADYPW